MQYIILMFNDCSSSGITMNGINDVLDTWWNFNKLLNNNGIFCSAAVIGVIKLFKMQEKESDA